MFKIGDLVKLMNNIDNIGIGIVIAFDSRDAVMYNTKVYWIHYKCVNWYLGRSLIKVDDNV